MFRDDSKEIKLEIPNREKIRKSWFSGNGIFVFVQSSAGTRTYNFRVWRVIPSISPPTLYQYQVRKFSSIWQLWTLILK